jgi:hypothetical protein
MIAWPPLLTPRSIEFTFDSRSRSGGVSINGLEQLVASGGGVWRARLISIPVVTETKRRVWRAIQAQTQGRAKEVLVPVFCIDQPEMIGGIPHSDGTFFSDGSGYSQGSISAELTEDAPLRATQITLNVAGSSIDPGHYFEIGNGRLHTISALVEEDGDEKTFDIWPPLREAATAGSSANFSDPKCRMRLATDDAMKAEFELGRFAFPTVEFIEAL